MKEIISLTIGDPDVRKALRDSERICLLTDMTKNEELDRDITKWASRALCAVENEHVHARWSKVVAGELSEHELQHLLEGSVTSESGELADLARSLRCVFSRMFVKRCPADTIENYQVQVI